MSSTRSNGRDNPSRKHDACAAPVPLLAIILLVAVVVLAVYIGTNVLSVLFAVDRAAAAAAAA